MIINKWFSQFIICTALGATVHVPTSLFAQTTSTAEESTNPNGPRSLRDLRDALNDRVSGVEREQVFLELEMLGADGNGSALITLGNALRDAGDVGRAIAAYEAAIELDEPRASTMLMRIFRDADSPFHDPERATAMMQNAANLGDLGARFGLARALLNGDGVAKDPMQARQMLLGPVDNQDSHLV